jgi:hypothetical protein
MNLSQCVAKQNFATTEKHIFKMLKHVLCETALLNNEKKSVVVQESQPQYDQEVKQERHYSTLVRPDEVSLSTYSRQ